MARLDSLIDSVNAFERPAFGVVLLAFALLATPSTSTAQATPSGASPHVIPFFLPASSVGREGFARIINHSDVPGTVRIYGIDDAGEESGPTSLALEAGATAHFNSGDLERGNAAKGLSGGLGSGEGSWRLRLRTDLDIEALAYIRTADGFVTSMHDVVREAGRWHVPTFNPGSNHDIRSRLRLTNLTESAVEVTIRGRDDDGVESTEAVRLTLEAGASRMVSAQALESGESEPGSGALSGRLGDGQGKWQLFVTATGAIEVMSLLDTRSGHLTNLSASSIRGMSREEAREKAVAEGYVIPFFLPASSAGREGFARIINHSDVSGTVSIRAIDDAGREHGPVSLALGAMETAHFNSGDLERGNVAKGLSGGVGSGEGSWRLRLRTDLDIEALAYIRTTDGFLTSMHDVVREARLRWHVPTFNPASNRDIRSHLRLINPAGDDVDVAIRGRDDAGESSPEGEVDLTLSPGEARVLSAQALEEGGDGLFGRLGDGAGKWQLFVSAEAPIEVMNLMETRSGHLANLSTSPLPNIVTVEGVDALPRVAIDSGADLTVKELEVLELRASASDPDGSIVAWRWEQISGPRFEFAITDSRYFIATAPLVASDTYAWFRVTVTDEAGNRASDEVRVRVEVYVPEYVPIEVEVRIPDGVTSVTEAELTVTALGSERLEVAVGGASTLLLASDAEGPVLMAAANEDGGFLREGQGNARLGIDSTAVVLVALAAGYPIPAIDQRIADAVVSHADYAELRKQLTRLMSVDRRYLERLEDDYPDVAGLIERMAASINEHEAKALRAALGIATEGPALKSEPLAKSALPHGIRKDGFYCTPLIRWPCSPWDEHEPWQWFGDATGVAAFAPDDERGEFIRQLLGRQLWGLIGRALYLGYVSTEGYLDLLPEATHPPFLARSHRTPNMHAMANPGFVNYAMELYEGSEYKDWYLTPRNSTIVQKLSSSGAAHREVPAGLSPDIDRVRFQRYRFSTSDEEKRAQIISFLNTFHLIVSGLNLAGDFSAFGEWLEKLAMKDSVHLGSCAVSVLNTMDFFHDPNADAETNLLTFVEHNATSLFETLLDDNACRQLVSSTGKSLVSLLGKTARRKVEDGTLTVVTLGGKIAFDAANDLVPVATSYFSPGLQSEYYLQWERDGDGHPYIAAVTERPLPTADFVYAQQTGFRVRLDASKSTGEGLTYRWYVDDDRRGVTEQIGSGRTLVHDFRETGSYRVHLHVTEPNGVSASTVGSVEVTAGRVPEIHSLSCIPAGTGKRFTMQAGFSDEDGDISSVEWFSLSSNTHPDRVSGPSTAPVELTAPSGATFTRAKVEVTDARGNSTRETCDVDFGEEAPPAPDLVVADFYATEERVRTGGTLELKALIENRGTRSSPGTIVRYYLSEKDANIIPGSSDDSQVDTESVNGIAPEDITIATERVAAPSTPGIYHYGACVGTVSQESNPLNNCSWPGFEVVVFGSGASGADLAVTEFDVSKKVVKPGERLKLEALIENQGTGPAPVTPLQYYLSGDSTITRSDTKVGTDKTSKLPPSETDGERTRLDAPSSPDTYYYGACVDEVEGETNTDNNCSRGVEVIVSDTDSDVDLIIDLDVNKERVKPGEALKLSATIENRGTEQAPKTPLQYYLSEDSTITRSDTQVEKDKTDKIDALGSDEEYEHVEAPPTPGIYYYGACVDEAEGETNTANNCSSGVPVTVDPPPREVDLGIRDFFVNDSRGPLTVSPGDSLRLEVLVANVGPEDFSSSADVRYYRSTDSSISSADERVGADTTRDRGIASGEFVREYHSVKAPSSGTWYYGACVDAVEGETNTTNNCFSPGFEVVVSGGTTTGKLYWTDWVRGTISRADVDGSGIETLLTDLPGPEQIALDLAGGKMYWTDWRGYTISRANLDGSGRETLLAGLRNPESIALDVVGSKLYWTDGVRGTISRADLDGSGRETLVSGLGDPDGISLDVTGGKMYWSRWREGTISRANLDGSGRETLVSGLGDPVGIALDVTGGRMYWADAERGTISRADLDGSGREILASSVGRPGAIALDVVGGKLYWTDGVRGTISRADLDGSEVETLLTGLDGLQGIALDLRGRDGGGFEVGARFRDCTDCPEMVVVPSGSFMMGSPESEARRESSEGPVRRVTLSRPFAVGVYEVTFDEWDACHRAGGCSHNPDDEGWGRGNRPVIHVSWHDAQEYVGWLSRMTGKGYRLPSESEWEYVARAGTTTPFHTGETISTEQANYNGSYTYGSGTEGIWRRQTVPVESFPSNGFGLHDVHGNVWEWVRDCWNGSYEGAPTDGSAWESGDCRFRWRRGGSWYDAPRYLRSAYRNRIGSGYRSGGAGFRVTRTLD